MPAETIAEMGPSQYEYDGLQLMPLSYTQYTRQHERIHRSYQSHSLEKALLTALAFFVALVLAG